MSLNNGSCQARSTLNINPNQPLYHSFTGSVMLTQKQVDVLNILMKLGICPFQLNMKEQLLETLNKIWNRVRNLMKN